MHEQLSSDCVSIPVYSKRQVAAFALVDPADAHLADHHWWLSHNGYVARVLPRNGRRSSPMSFLHREVMAVTTRPPYVDHINGDPLDNRRCNLRVVTHQENCQNTSGNSGATSKYRNVSWDKKAQRWKAQVTVRGHNYFLGYYRSEEEAADVAREARARLMPFANEDRSVRP